MDKNTNQYKDVDWKMAAFNKIMDDDNLGIPIPFTITGITNKGFIVRAYSLICFVPFLYMPWQYIDHKYWNVFYKVIRNKILYGKVLSKNEELFTYFLNANIPQFNEVVLEKGIEYSGVILKKENSYVVIDIGYQFGWACGSITGILRREDFNLDSFANIYKIGEPITVYLTDKLLEGTFFKKEQINRWISKEKSKLLIGKTITAKVVNTDGITIVELLDGYRAVLPINNTIYENDFVERIVNFIADVKIGDELICNIINVDRLQSHFIVEWLHPFKEIFDWELSTRDNMIGKKVLIEVLRVEKEEYGFFVFKNCKAILPVTDVIYNASLLNVIYNRLISKRPGEQIEGEILSIDEENKTFIVKWILPDIKAFKIKEI